MIKFEIYIVMICSKLFYEFIEKVVAIVTWYDAYSIWSIKVSDYYYFIIVILNRNVH